MLQYTILALPPPSLIFSRSDRAGFLEIGLVPFCIWVAQVWHWLDIHKVFLYCDLEPFQSVLNILDDFHCLKSVHLPWIGFLLSKSIAPLQLLFLFLIIVWFEKCWTSSSYHDEFWCYAKYTSWTQSAALEESPWFVIFNEPLVNLKRWCPHVSVHL